MKKLLLTILLMPVLANAQLQNYLTGSTPKTHRELQGSPTATTRLDTIIHSITIALDSTMSSLQRYSLNAGNYATIGAGLSDARSNSAPLIVPYDWTGSSPSPTSADSNVTILDYRFGSFGFTGRRHWGFKSVWEADSLNRFRKILDSTRTWGRINLAEGTWSLDSIRISRPMFLQGTGINRIKTADTVYGGSMLKSTATSTAINLLRVDQSGVYLSDMTLQGNSRLNGHGFYSQRQPVSGTINTTLGGYGLTRVSSFFHGGSGFYLIGGDGNIYHELESFRNAGYGVVGISPASAGLASAGGTARGTTNLYEGGRTRGNSLGGWLFDDQATTGFLNAEAIADTGVGVWFKNGTSRSWVWAGDVELQIPARTSTPLTYGIKVEDMQGFYMGQTFIGTQHDFGDFTADAGTNTTTIVDAALVNYGPDDYFVGSDVVNNTRSSGEVKITDYVASTGTLTLASAIASQTTGDSYSLSKDQNAGLRLKNLTSGIFVNNAFGSNVDTMIATVGDGGALFINNINFDPKDNLKEISGTFKWLNINTSNVDSLSGGVNTILMEASNDFIIQSMDSLLLRSTGSLKGIEIEATQGKVAIQPNAEGGVHLFGQVGDDENPDLRIYYDADTTTGVTSAKYFDFGGSITQPDIFNIQNVDASQKLSFGTTVRFSGENQTERQAEFQNHSGGTSLTTPANGFVKLYARGDTLYAKDDNGVERSLYAAAGASGDITSVGDVASGAAFDGTQGTTLTFNNAGGDATQAYDGSVIAFSHPLTVQASDPADAEAIRLDNNEGIAWEASPAGTDVTLKVDASEILQASAAFNAVTLTESNNAVPNSTDHLGFFAATTSSQLAGVLSDEVGTDGGFLRVEATGASAGNTIVRRASGVWVDSTLSAGSGDVVGPASSTDEAVARFDGTTGKLLQNTSALTLSDAGAFTFPDGVKQTFNPNGTTAGLNLGGQAGNPSSLAVGDAWYNTTTDKAMLYEGSYAVPVLYDPSLMYRLFEDWESGATNTSGAMGLFWNRTIATSGTTTHQAGEAGRPGIMRYFCANSAGSTAALHSDLTSYLVTTGYEFKTSVRFSSLGTAGSNGAYYRVGFMDGVASTIPTNGIWVEFNVDSSATRFRTITSNGGTRTINTYTGVSIATSTWYKIEIIPNSNATSVVFKLDGTTMFTHTTNIPTGNTVGVAGVAAAVTASTTKYMEQDYVAVVNKSMSR